MHIHETGVFDAGWIFWGLGLLLLVGLAVMATFRVARLYRGTSTLPAWLLLIWLLPLVGPILSLASVPKTHR